MKHFRLRCSALASMALAVSIGTLPVSIDSQNSAARSNITPQPEAAVVQRANNLLRQMTPEEKVGQLSQIFVFGPSKSAEDRIRAGQLGSVLFLTNPAQINRLQHAL